jgi:uncharacterized membrane protein
MYRKIGVMMVNKGVSIVRCYDSVEYKGSWWVFLEVMSGNIGEIVTYFKEHDTNYGEPFIAYVAWSVL